MVAPSHAVPPADIPSDAEIDDESDVDSIELELYDEVLGLD
jgi:hypothetical protein